MAEFVEVAQLDKIPPGSGTTVTVAAKDIALFQSGWRGLCVARTRLWSRLLPVEDRGRKSPRFCSLSHVPPKGSRR
jgi:hypothetical protein